MSDSPRQVFKLKFFLEVGKFSRLVYEYLHMDQVLLTKPSVVYRSQVFQV